MALSNIILQNIKFHIYNIYLKGMLKENMCILPFNTTTSLIALFFLESHLISFT